ncbi:MAG: NAD(P)-dependent alcohol dehydrogenase [Flavobacteriales bacterium]|nr:NAD(P)-dependent alcohol dehydrogenase [Flavobacteriales bacterium]
MKAIVCKHYGPPEELQYKDVPQLEPRKNQIRIRVKAAAINDYDWSLVRGKPTAYRLIFGLRKPRKPIPGMEVAGIVDAVGPGATRFNIGDAVYGDTSDHGFGSFAEYLCIDERAVLLKPEHLTFVEATAVPHALCLAHQGLQLGGLLPKMNVLINGAGGGVGTFALQLAKRQGATVTGVDTGDKLEQMRALGFDHIIDYKTQDFTTTGQHYDLVLDTKSTRSPASVKHALAPGGVYVTVGGDPGRLIQFLFARIFGQKNIRILALKPNKGLEALHPLFAEGLRPVVDGPHPLTDVPQLIRYFGEGKHFGKVVVVVWNIDPDR